MVSRARTLLAVGIPMVMVIGGAMIGRACGGGVSSARESTVVTEKSNNRRVKLVQGALLTVSLESQLGTGYGWSVAENDTSRLRLQGEPTVEGGSGMPGGAERQVFRFKALTVGSTVLELHYRRPFERSVAPERTFLVRVEIRKARSGKVKTKP